MKRGRPSKLIRTTALGQMVRAVRDEEGWSQKEFEEKLGLDLKPGYVSKVETGTVQKPSAEFLEALARLLAKPFAELKELAGRPADEGVASMERTPTARPTFPLVFGHCIWAAPIVVAAVKGLIPQFQCGSFSDSTGEDDQLCWITKQLADELRNNRAKVPGPSSEAAGLEPLSAVNALRMLERGDVDVAVVPGNLIEDKKFSWLVRIGTVIDSATGCSLVCDQNLWKRLSVGSSRSGGAARNKYDAIFASELGEVVAGSESEGPHIGIEPGTIAEEVLQDAFAQFDRERAPDLWWSVMLELPNRNLALPDSFSKLESECARKSAGIGIITWEPHATWVKNSYSASLKKKLHDCPIQFSRGSDGRPTHITFELVMRRDDVVSTQPKARDLRVAVYKLMQSLGDCAEALNEIESESLVIDRTAVEVVGRYFDLLGSGSLSAASGTPDTSNRRLFEPTIHAIGGVRYSVRWDNEALDLMGFRPS